MCPFVELLKFVRNLHGPIFIQKHFQVTQKERWTINLYNHSNKFMIYGFFMRVKLCLCLSPKFNSMPFNSIEQNNWKLYIFVKFKFHKSVDNLFNRNINLRCYNLKNARAVSTSNKYRTRFNAITALSQLSQLTALTHTPTAPSFQSSPALTHTDFPSIMYAFLIFNHTYNIIIIL